MKPPLRLVTTEDRRPTLANVLMTVAHVFATRSTCLRGQTGAVICSPEWALLTAGYNGAPSGQPHCQEVGCEVVDGHCLRTVHAEMNALLQAARLGVQLEGSYLLATHRPCLRCAPAIVRAGIAGVMFASPYDSDNAYDRVAEIFFEANTDFGQLAYAAVTPYSV